MRSALFALSLLGACAAREINQPADAVLLDFRSPFANPPASTSEPRRFREALTFGSADFRGDHRVPAQIEWTVAEDAEGCLRVQTVQIRRSGGPTTTEIYDTKASAQDTRCTSRDLSATETFDRVYISFCWRWVGALSDKKCAYGNSFFISADDGLGKSAPR